MIIPNATYSANVPPAVWLRGEDADSVSGIWTPHVGNGEQLTEFGLDPITYHSPTPFLDGNQAVAYHGNNNGHRSATSAFADIPVGVDVVIELVCYVPPTPDWPVQGPLPWINDCLAKRSGATGWELRFQTYGGVTSQAAPIFVVWNNLTVNDYVVYGMTSGAGIALGAWNIFHFGLNRDEFPGLNAGRWLVNGVPQNTNETVAGAGDLSDFTSVSELYVGDPPATDRKGNIHVAHLALYHQSNWFRAGADGIADFDAEMANRAWQMMGIWPTFATAAEAPIVATRNSHAALDRIESGEKQFYWVGENWMRVVGRESATAVPFSGYLPTDDQTNNCLWNEDLSVAPWTKVNVGDTITPNADAAPDDMQVGTAIIADATDTQHGVEQPIFATGNIWVQTWLKPGNKAWCRLSLGTSYSFLNLVTGAVGANNNSGLSFVDLGWKNGYAAIGFSPIGIAPGSHLLRISPADDNGDDTFAGDGVTPNLYAVWPHVGVQHYVHLLPPIRTQGAAVTQVEDTLVYEGNANVNGPLIERCSLEAQILFPPHVGTALTPLTALHIYAAATNAGYTWSDVRLDRISGSIGAVGMVTQGGLARGTTNLANSAEIQTLRGTYEENDVRVYLDGVEEGFDLSTDPPLGAITRLIIGSRVTHHSAMPIGRVKVLDRPEAP